MSSTAGTVGEAEARYAARRQRIERLMVALDLDVPATEDLLGHSDYRHKPMRWVVETKSAKGFGHSLTGTGSREHAEQIAGANIHEGWWPVALYDLDDLAGDEPEPEKDDTIRVDGAEFVVSSTDWKDGQRTVSFWDGGCFRWEYADDVEAVERVTPDERLPVRYRLARVAVFAAFDNTPEG